MPVEDHAVHEKVIQKEGFRDGCWNKPRPIANRGVESSYNGGMWPYIFSTECRFDMSLTDPACDGCQWRGSGEKYAEEIRRNGK